MIIFAYGLKGAFVILKSLIAVKRGNVLIVLVQPILYVNVSFLYLPTSQELLSFLPILCFCWQVQVPFHITVDGPVYQHVLQCLVFLFWFYVPIRCHHMSSKHVFTHLAQQHGHEYFGLPFGICLSMSYVKMICHQFCGII